MLRGRLCIQSKMRFPAFILCVGLALSAQTTPRPSSKVPVTPKLTKEQGFVMQVIRSAVALPQPDQQDRLRVLNSAAAVASTIDPKYSAQIAKEGVELETFLVANGQTPAVSIMASGYAACGAMKSFAEQLDPKSVPAAEQSLIGAITKCPKATLEIVRQKVDFALEQKIIAPRLLMALMEKTGPSAVWTRQRFESLFSTLPDPQAGTSVKAAPDYAAMYSGMAARIGGDIARSTGVKFLEWLAKMDASPERSAALGIATSGMQQALGKEKYEELWAGNVMLRQLVQEQGPAPDLTPEEEEGASALRAMGSEGSGQQESLREMPPAQRAREAAAYGFARGTANDKDSASTFFDMAFSAADDVWSQRSSNKNAPDVIEEVAEAAAHVDAVDALRRTQRLQDPTAQAIGMIAVARVVAGRDTR